MFFYLEVFKLKDVMDKMLQQERYDISKGVSSPKPLEKPQGGN